MMIIRSLCEDGSTGKFFIMNLSKDDMLLMSEGLERLEKNPMGFNPKRIQSMIRNFNDPNFVVDNANIHPLYTKQNDGYEFVDLGLPSGLLWATCNVGASSPEQAGLYFAWGETKGYTAEQVKSGKRRFDKKIYEAKKTKTNLTLEQDAAHTYMGGKWRMPTKEEWQEMINSNYTTTTWTTDYNGTGMSGHVITSKSNGNSIFLPAAGVCDGSSMDYVGSGGYYWSSTYYSSSYAYYLYFTAGGIGTDYYYYRYCGCSVRGVCER